MDAPTPTEQRPKKTANMNAYMNAYMKAKYHEDPVKSKNYKNSLYTKKKYNINDETWNKYKENLHHIFRMKTMIDELPSGVFELFLMEYKTLNFGGEAKV
jgi:hypothetical protein